MRSMSLSEIRDLTLRHIFHRPDTLSLWSSIRVYRFFGYCANRHGSRSRYSRNRGNSSAQLQGGWVPFSTSSACLGTVRTERSHTRRVKEMSFFWEVSGTSVQGNQSPRTARLTPPFPRSLRKDQHRPVHPRVPSAIASVGVIW